MKIDENSGLYYSVSEKMRPKRIWK